MACLSQSKKGIVLISEFYEHNPKMTQKAIAQHFNVKFKTNKPIGQTIICEILKRRETFYDNENLKHFDLIL